MLFVEIKQITVDKIITGGDGLGYIDGKAHFIPGALPGEVVEIEILQSKKGYNRCRVVRVIEESKVRTAPFCPYYNSCGGCSLQHVFYDDQLKVKKDIITDVFRRNGKLDLNDFNIVPSADRGYRNRVQFHIDGKKIGFKKKFSDEVIGIDSCPLLVKGLNKFINNGLDTSDKRVTLFSPDDAYYIGGVDRECVVKIKNRDIAFNPKGFFQSNLSMMPPLIDRVNSFVKGKSVMDLYCGVGLFSSFLPESVTDIIAVELDSRVEEFVNKNLSDKNYKFYPLSLENYIKKGLNKKNIADTIIIDPPRKGLSEGVRKYLIKSGVKRLIYVSCDPVTMARDIRKLADGGYKLGFYEAYDFYPHTPHIESLGILDLE